MIHLRQSYCECCSRTSGGYSPLANIRRLLEFTSQEYVTQINGTSTTISILLFSYRRNQLSIKDKPFEAKREIHSRLSLEKKMESRKPRSKVVWSAWAVFPYYCSVWRFGCSVLQMYIVSSQIIIAVMLYVLIFYRTSQPSPSSGLPSNIADLRLLKSNYREYK